VRHFFCLWRDRSPCSLRRCLLVSRLWFVIFSWCPTQHSNSKAFKQQQPSSFIAAANTILALLFTRTRHSLIIYHHLIITDRPATMTDCVLVRSIDRSERFPSIDWRPLACKTLFLYTPCALLLKKKKKKSSSKPYHCSDYRGSKDGLPSRRSRSRLNKVYVRSLQYKAKTAVKLAISKLSIQKWLIMH